jgi:hypothetical protein
MERVRRFIVTHLWWVVLVVALAMLISHSFGVRGIVVDNISLILLAIVLISPFVAAIKKVKIGDFEAEIEPEEVKRVAQKAEKSLPLLNRPHLLLLPSAKPLRRSQAWQRSILWLHLPSCGLN